MENYEGVGILIQKISIQKKDINGKIRHCGMALSIFRRNPNPNLDETYIHSTYCAGKCWQSEIEEGVLSSDSKWSKMDNCTRRW